MEEVMKKKKGKRWVSIVFKTLAFLVVFLFLGVLLPFVVEIPLYLAFGWFFFLKENLSRIDFGWEMIASSVIGMAFCVWLTHSFCRWVAKEKSAAPWRFIQTLRLNFLVFVFFAASCALVGFVHQSLWLFSNPVVVNRLYRSIDKIRDSNNMKQVHMLILDYEDEYGKFPDSLEDLRKEDPSRWGEIFFSRKEKVFEPFLYFGKGRSSSDDGGRLLLASPFVHKGHVVYVSIDGRAKDERIADGKKGQEQFEKLIRDGVWPKASPENDANR